VWPLTSLGKSLGKVSAPLLRRLLKNVLGLGDQPKEISPGQALVLWTADTLAIMQPVSDDKRTSLLEALHAEIAAVGDKVSSSLEDKAVDKLPVGLLTIANRHWSWVSGSEKVIDLEKGEDCKKLPGSPLEYITYDLTELFVSRLRRMKA
jgi:hypothetical protein